MRLSHWSEHPLTEVQDMEPGGAVNPGKPSGLWVSVDGEFDWAEWCESEMPEWIADKRRYEVVLAPGANVLHLDSEEAVREFNERWSFVPDWMRDSTGFYREVDWAGVGARYDGIIISPYQWGLRHDMSLFWYYGWDCASGCIWSAGAVKEVVPWHPEG